MQEGFAKFLGKVNYLRKFVAYLSGKIIPFTPILCLKNKSEFTLGAPQQEAFDKIKEYLSTPPVLGAPRRGIPFKLYVAAEEKSHWCYVDSRGQQERICYCIYWPTSS
jgi:hypothetical protein